MTLSTVRAPIGKVEGRIIQQQEDSLAVEEPLEIRVGTRSLSETMRTPGHDFDLTAGFLFAEDIIGSAMQIRATTSPLPNIVAGGVVHANSHRVRSPHRALIMKYACGVA